MSIRLKTIIGIVLIETVALAIVVWANLHVLVQSSDQLLAEQARAVAKMAAEPAARAYQEGPGPFRDEIRRLRGADPRLAWVKVLQEGDLRPQSSREYIVRTVEIRDVQDEENTISVSLALDRTTMLAARDSALEHGLVAAVAEVWLHIHVRQINRLIDHLTAGFGKRADCSDIAGHMTRIG